MGLNCLSDTDVGHKQAARELRLHPRRRGMTGLDLLTLTLLGGGTRSLLQRQSDP